MTINPELFKRKTNSSDVLNKEWRESNHKEINSWDDFFEGVLTGTVKVLGSDIKTITPGEMGKNIASIFQNPRSQFFTTNSTKEVAFALENYGIDRDEMIDSFSSSNLEKVVEYLISKDYVITNYFDMTETEG